ncbi:MAG: glycosyltransferase involved in cell wall biosynthesis/predicted SAM-dependent methyltransferase [Pirellulaceae bacterium]|jgi:glycosyltransferase involved in cell wall biosynthesis/predicted SAM-dependent methyltransferase
MPFNIELIIADRGWILEKIAEEIQKQCYANWNVRIATEPSDWADLHYFIPYSKFPAEKLGPSICFFTHREDVEPARSNFLLQAQRSDYCVTLSGKYERLLRANGIENVRTIESGVDLEAFDIRLQIGVVGRTYHTGRKGEDLVAACMDIENIDFLFTGSGWPAPSVHLDESELPGFFNRLDYLLIPSRIEGGPVPLMEALASGCEVIAPSDIGFVEKFPHIQYENGNVESLRKTLIELVGKRKGLRDSVQGYSWEAFGKRHVELFEEIAEQHGFPAGSDERPIAELERIFLVSNGIEIAHKGGPTTRMRIITDYAKEHGLSVKTVQDIAELSGRDTDSSIVHVFNSWPLDFAVEQLRMAKEKGYQVVYSPIALNLENMDYFSFEMPRVAVNGNRIGNAHNDKAGSTLVARGIRSAGVYDENVDLKPLEGVTGHFWSLRESVGQADGLLLLSQYERSFLERISCALPDFKVIDNGVDSAVMAAGDPRLFKDKYNVDRYVLCVGRIEARKNQAAVAAALAHSDLKLVLLGSAVDKDYLKVLKRCGGENMLHIEHIEDRELLASAYRGATVFLMASWSEGAPLAALEAASAGCPMVLSAMSSEREYFGEDALYVQPGDMQDIADKVNRVATDSKLQSAHRREELSLKYQARFSAEKHAENTATFYRQVLSAKQAKQHGQSTPLNEAKADDSSLADLVANRPGEKIKLHLGCGGIRWKDFINVDLYPEVEGVQDLSRSGCVADVFEDIRFLGLSSETVDEIYSSHVVEHFVRWEACEMLKEWASILKPGGRMVIEMPSFWRCVAWLFHPSSKKRSLARSQFYGNQWDRLDFETHRYVWSAGEVRKMLSQLGFRRVRINHRTKTHHPGRDMRIVAVK